MTPQLETERLLLRLPRRDDVDALAAVFADPDAMRFIGSGRTLTRRETVESVERMIARFTSDGFGLFSVERRADGRMIGRVGLLAWDPATWTPGTRAELGDRAEIEIGWTLARDAWGNGYATEAAAAVRDWAFGELALRRLVSLIQPGNAGSIRVAEKLGARLEREIVTGSGQHALLYAVQHRPNRTGAKVPLTSSPR